MENLLLTGTAAIGGAGNAQGNRLVGNTAANALLGLGGNDVLLGGGGGDRLNGGVGADTQFGGLGNDVFVFTNRLEAGDAIQDFGDASGNNDRLELTAAAFGSGLVAGTSVSLAQFQVVATGSVISTTASSGQVRFLWEQDDERLWSDINGSASGGLVLLADLQDGAVLRHTDLLLV